MEHKENYHYGMVGNCTSAALIADDASIDWLCLPAFDSPSLFGRLVDEDKGGSFQICGVNTSQTSQCYLQDTAIMKTTFETEDGAFEVHDYMPRYALGNGQYYCPAELHRAIRVIDGAPKIRIIFDPKPNYALGGVVYEKHAEYIKLISEKGDYISYYLYSNLDYEKILHGEEIRVEPNAYMVLSYHEKLDPFTTYRIYHEFEKTKAYWLDYVDQTSYPERYREAVLRSMITLKMLSYEKTGAVLAAPTTSLPETIGGERNWDYRYCWMRDGGMTIDVYARLGDLETSARFMQYILQRLPLKNDPIQLMYSIDGDEVLDEKIQDHLAGYAQSRPVRVGNDAYRQKQHDLYGHLIEAIYTFFVFNNTIKHKDKTQTNEEIWTLVRSLVNHIKRIWREPDSGIWELRGTEQHFTHSKLMNWVGMDRAAKIAAFWGRHKYVQEWTHLADEIKEDILTHAWSNTQQAFTMSYGSDDLDASVLLMLHYNFLPFDDQRIVQTVQTCYAHLVRNGFMFRYTVADDFGEPENAFLVCTFWMVNALYLVGERTKARHMFEHALKSCNHLGLLSEHIEVYSGRLTGNFPQAYSHLALIQAAFVLETEYNWLDKDAMVKGHR